MAAAAFIFFCAAIVFPQPPVPGDFVINEILADPASDLSGDANGDGVRDAADDEFIEIVNVSASNLDISGLTLSDDFATKHVFPAGTVVSPESSVVVFGGGTPTGLFGGALVQTATTGGLGLNNGGDTINLKAGSIEIAVFTYPQAGCPGDQNQSMTLDPDLTGICILHSVATGSGGSLFSPGTLIDGTSFGNGGTSVLPGDFVINELLADPAPGLDGDANGDGIRDASDDEFVEIVNVSTFQLDISGLTLASSSVLRHTFPVGTTVPPDCAVVVFGGGLPAGSFGGALVQTATSGSLALGNSGDTMTMSNGFVEIDSFAYGPPPCDGSQDQSLTLDPDLTGSCTMHSLAVGSGGALFSPGTRIDSATFGNCAKIFTDGFESGDTTSWTSTTG